MKKDVYRKNRKPRREVSVDEADKSAESTSAQKLSAVEPKATNPFSRFTHFIKSRFQKESKEPAIAEEQPLKTLSASAKQPKPEFESELKQLIASKEDAVNKLYRLDLILRRYYGKEYKVGKKLPYNEIIVQLEKKQEAAAASLLKKIIAYAYSGRPLENPQMRELLSDFQQLLSFNAARHAAEKEARQKQKKISVPTPFEEREALAGKLTPIVPQLLPRSEPFVHILALDLKKYRVKLRGVLDKITGLRLPNIVARAHLPSATHRTPQKRPEQQSPAHLNTTRLQPHLPQLRLPQLRLPDGSNIQGLNLKRPLRTAIHAARLHLPKIRLPEFNRHESHAPRSKLPSWRAVKEKIPHVHVPQVRLPQLRLPNFTQLAPPHSRLPQIKESKTQRTPSSPHTPKLHGAHQQFRIPPVRKLLHLPKFHPMLYYERIKEHIQELHPIEYTRTVADHIPRPHPREYYESMKETLQAAWEKIHPQKQSEEELALQAELAQEQAEVEQQAQTAVQPETIPEAPETEETLLTPKPVVVKPESYWVEYRPRKHVRDVEHHIAYELDDLHHVKEIVKKHYKAALV